jgi:hypothetical protein
MQDEEGGGIRSIRIILLVPTMSMSMILVLRRIKIRAKDKGAWIIRHINFKIMNAT